jgi:peroxiredoxin
MSDGLFPARAGGVVIRAWIASLMALIVLVAAGCNPDRDQGSTASNNGAGQGGAVVSHGPPLTSPEAASGDGTAEEPSVASTDPATADNGSAASSGDEAPDAGEPANGGEPAPVDPATPTEPVPPAAGSSNVAGGTQAAPKPAPPPAEVHKPEIVLSENHAATCVIGVGDPFPAISLPDLDGKTQELRQLLGDRMTIVVFWTSSNLYAREQFARVMQEAHNRYAALGVKVVTINVGDSAEAVQKLAAQNNVAVPCLLDTDQEAFQQVARGLLPRTYLLDAEGRVLWFDLEYSRGQRLGLHNAVHFHLKQGGV